VFGELFQDRETINWAFPDFYGSKEERFSLQTNPVLFLEKEIFRIYPKEIDAVGFKIFYYHAQKENWKSVWRYLRDHKDLKVIHLRRKNILEAHLSWQRAVSTGKWINLTGESENVEQITLDYDECIDDFIKTRKWEQEYDAFFAQHEKLNVIYECLTKDPHFELQRIQEFLGVQEMALSAKTTKQRHQPLSEAISNYSELKQRFQGSPWAEFFEE
jgi:LPS sulfotransferase NodH